MNNPRVIDQSVITAAINDLDGIQQAITARDQNVAVPNGTPVSQYPAKIASIGTNWIRPADWIPIDTVDANSITFTVADSGNMTAAFVLTFLATGAQATIDWGDGTPLVTTTATTAANGASSQSHTYTKGAGKLCSRGYTTFKVVIKPVGTATITKFIFQWLPTFVGPPCMSILEVNVNVGTLTNLDYMCYKSTSPAFNCYMLENVKFSGSLANVTSAQYSFQYCYALAKVTGLNMPACVNLYDMFYSCASLRELDISNLLAATTFTMTFYSMYSFGNIIDMSSASHATNMNCYGNYNLKGLLVSNQAPFTGSAPQIDVGYTGMDAAALNALFTSLPNVTAGQTLKMTGSVGAATATTSIATAKGWSVTA